MEWTRMRLIATIVARFDPLIEGSALAKSVRELWPHYQDLCPGPPPTDDEVAEVEKA